MANRTWRDANVFLRGVFLHVFIGWCTGAGRVRTRTQRLADVVAGDFVPAVVAAAAMNLSSLSVVGNALRLRAARI